MSNVDGIYCFQVQKSVLIYVQVQKIDLISTLTKRKYAVPPLQQGVTGVQRSVAIAKIIVKQGIL